MFGWLKRIFQFDKNMDSLSNKNTFEEITFCKAREGNNILMMDGNCSLISELRQNQKFVAILEEELSKIQDEFKPISEMSSIRLLFQKMNDKLPYTFTRHLICAFESSINEVNLPALIKELELIESNNKIEQEYRNNISAAKNRVGELKCKLGIY